MRYHAANRFQTRLAASVDESQIYFDVESASGCPEVPFKLTVGTEIVNVIGVVGNTFTVQRGAEGTTPQSHPQGSLVQNRWTAGTYEDLWDGVEKLQGDMGAHEENTTDAHGIDEHFDATAEDDVHGLLSGGFIIEESGSNDNGFYVRWSNGLQICWILSITLTYVNATTLRARWDFPAEFKSGSTPAGFANPNEYASQVSARTAGTVVGCAESYCNVVASAATGVFGEDDTWEFQAVAIGWWK